MKYGEGEDRGGVSQGCSEQLRREKGLPHVPSGLRRCNRRLADSQNFMGRFATAACEKVAID